VLRRPIETTAVTGHVGTGTDLSGNPTYQEFARARQIYALGYRNGVVVADLAHPYFFEHAAEVAAEDGLDVGLGVVAADEAFGDVEGALGDIKAIKSNLSGIP
jgi:hypothetical protein